MVVVDSGLTGFLVRGASSGPQQFSQHLAAQPVLGAAREHSSEQEQSGPHGVLRFDLE